MTVLSDRTIHGQLDSDDPSSLDIAGLDDRDQVQPCSVDLRLGHEVMKPGKGRIQSGDPITFYPGEFLLVSTIEGVRLPDGLCATIWGRSTFGRKGLQIHNAGFVDAGFEGQLTLEAVNFTEDPIKVDVGTRICQIAFHYMDRDAGRPYGEKEDAKYQEQEGTTGPRRSY